MGISLTFLAILTIGLPALGCAGTTAAASMVTVFHDAEVGQIRFAAAEILRALRMRGVEASAAPLGEFAARGAVKGIIVAVSNPTLLEQLKKAGGAPVPALPAEGYALRTTGTGQAKTYWAIGADANGAMYAGLDIAEAVRLEGGLDGLSDRERRPFVRRRGIKFNIPLDARTPSYDDTGDSAQTNIPHMWEFDFWRNFLDNMARYRYNALTLWNPHPFPSLIKLQSYPGISLTDVCVTTLKPRAEPRSWREPMFVYPGVFKHLKVVKRMTIDEKIAFWRRVMRHARERGIEIYFITWNVVVNAAEGKYGITAAQDNPRTIAYLRQCVRELILTYPDLTGIGTTAGENMRKRNDEFAKEKWLWRTYGLGVLDAKKQQPGRKVRFIHRVWQTGLDEVMREFGSKYPDPFEVSFKYARAHMYSSTKPPFAKKLVRELKRHGVKSWWNLRNDDIFVFRWGDPDYVREFLHNLPPAEVTGGYHMGSDGYVWGYEFASREGRRQRRLEIEKHWFKFMLWGRLGYDPSLDRAFFEKVLTARFPEARGLPVYDACVAASRIVPLVNRFHWRNWDFMWAVEGCMDQRKGFHTVDDFIKVRPMEGSGILSISDYLNAAGRSQRGISPVQVAGTLHRYARTALKHVVTIRQKVSAPGDELRATLADIEAMAHLGDYYAAKIAGAVALARFRRDGDPQLKETAVARLTEAVEHWRRYATVASSRYRPQLLARTRRLDWWKLFEDVKRDVDIARQATPR